MQSLKRRVEALEAVQPDRRFGAAILCGPGQTDHEAVAEYEAKHGRIEGEPFLIRLVGIKPLCEGEGGDEPETAH